MVQLVTDFDVNGRIIRGVRRKRPTIDIVRMQDTGLAQDTPDPDLLEWAAKWDRIVITQDRNSMVGFAHDRVTAGKAMPGLIVVDNTAAIGTIIDDIPLIDDLTTQGEWANRVDYLPL